MATSSSGTGATVEPTKVDISTFLGVIWGGSAVAIICVSLRVMSRARTFKRLFADDVFVLFALTFVLTSAGLWQVHAQEMFDLMAVGAGIKTPGPNFVARSEAYSKASAAVIVLFYSTLWSVKIAFLMFFRRLTTDIFRQRFWWWAVFCFTLATYFACIGTIQYNCLVVPLEEIMTRCTQNSAVNFQQTTLKLNCAWDVLTDFMIMSIPISLLWGTQMRLRRKLGLGLIFSLTILTIVFAIVRTTVVSSLTRMPDTSWLYMWSAIETTVAILVVCLASIRKLFSNQEPPKYEPTKPSELSLRRKQKLDRLRQLIDNLSGSFSNQTYNRAESLGEQDHQHSGVREEQIMPLERVHYKESVPSYSESEHV